MSRLVVSRLLNVTGAMSLAFLFNLVLAVSAHAYFESYLPGFLQGNLKTAPQKFLFEVTNELKTTRDGIEFSTPDGVLIMKGRTAAGKQWTAKIDPVGLGGEVLKADLDFNGQNDIIVRTGTGACGIAPPSRLVVFLFDGQKVPHMYDLGGFFSQATDGKPLNDFIRIGGRTVLLQSDLTYVTGKKKDRNYWRWHAYQFKNAQMSPLNGVVGGSVLPTFVWYTYEPNHKVSAISAKLEQTTRSQQSDAVKETPVELK